MPFVRGWLPAEDPQQNGQGSPDFTRDGTSKLVDECTYPPTGRRGVSRVYSDYAILDLGPQGARVRSTYGISLEELRSRTGLDVSSF